MDLDVPQQAQNHYAFWLGDGENAIYACLHLPQWQIKRADNNKKLGVVICSPIGYEYTHAHRSLRHLANAFAEQGIVSLRFDWHGTGDSTGDMLSPQRCNTWLENIDQAVTFLKRDCSVEQVALLGLRLGASLAALYASQGSQRIDYLIGWQAIRNGRSYVREMQAMQKVSAGAELACDGYIDSGGFILSDETAAELKGLNLCKLEFDPKLRVLLLERDDLSLDAKFAQSLRQAGLNVEQETFAGYLDMMAEPQFTKVPQACIERISTWLALLASSDGEQQASPLSPPLARRSVTFLISVDGELQGEQVSESLESIDNAGKPLFGVLTKAGGTSKTLVLLSNSGSVHHVGPNRLYVELARSLASAGFDCLRFDLETLGDSVCGKPLDENSDYPANDMQNHRAVIAYAKQLGYQKIIASGLCSGAHAAFHAALNNAEDVQHAILINPLTFDSVERARRLATGQALAYQTESDGKHYAQSFKDPSKWLKLFKGGVDLSYLLGFGFKVLVKKFEQCANLVKQKLGLIEPPKLARELLQFERNQQNLSLFVAELDPGVEILTTGAGKRLIGRQQSKGLLHIRRVKGANHTFSYKPHRDDFVTQYAVYLRGLN